MASTALSTRNPALLLMPENLDQAMRLADLMSRSGLVPDHLKGEPGNCLLIIEQSMRWHMSPYAVAQCSFFYKGKLGYEGKLIHAAAENSGVVTADGFNERYEGEYNFAHPEKATRKIILSATITGQSKAREVELDWVDAYTTEKDGKTIKGLWAKKANADQSLFYSSTRMFVRKYAPKVLLGVYSREEIDHPDKYNLQDDGPVIDGDLAPDEGTARDRVDASVQSSGERVKEAQVRANIEATPMDARVYEFNTLRFSHAFSKAPQWIEDWRKYVAGCVTADAPDRLANTYAMNAGTIDKIGDFDWEARTTVMEIIEDGKNSMAAARAAAEAKRQAKAPATVQQPEDGPPGDEPPPADYGDPGNEPPPPPPADQPQDAGNAPPPAEAEHAGQQQASETPPTAIAESAKRAPLTDEQTADLRQRARHVIHQLIKGVQHEARNAMFPEEGAKRVVQSLAEERTFKSLRVIRRAPCSDIYRELLAALASPGNETMGQTIMSELEEKLAVLYDDLVHYMDDQRVPA